MKRSSATAWVAGRGWRPGELPVATRSALADTTLPIVRLTDFDSQVGHAQAIGIGSDGVLTPGSDPRSEGAALLAGAPGGGS